MKDEPFTYPLANDLYETDSISKRAKEPLRVGVLKQSNNLGKYTTDNLMAYMARQFNIELYFFTTKDFNPEDKTIHATFLEGTSWIERTIPLPKITYNTFECFSGEPRKEIKSMLMKESYFVRRGIFMTKAEIYNKLIADGKFNEFLIESHTVKSFEHLLELLKQYNNDVVLKPIHGMQGTGINKITFNEKGYVIRNDTFGEKFFKTVDEFRNYYDENLAQSQNILQPYIVSRTKNGYPFDIRLHARRAAEGKFKVFPYPRIGGSSEGILSNISAGGHTMPIVKFLKEEFGNDWKIIQVDLMNLGEVFPDYFQSLLPKMITSMGLDVGIQRRGPSYELKLFEVNVGGPGFGAIPIEAAFANMEYLQYLGKTIGKTQKA